LRDLETSDPDDRAFRRRRQTGSIVDVQQFGVGLHFDNPVGASEHDEVSPAFRDPLVDCRNHVTNLNRVDTRAGDKDSAGGMRAFCQRVVHAFATRPGSWV
jgi:hypothetical protein